MIVPHLALTLAAVLAAEPGDALRFLPPGAQVVVFLNYRELVRDPALADLEAGLAKGFAELEKEGVPASRAEQIIVGCDLNAPAIFAGPMGAKGDQPAFQRGFALFFCPEGYVDFAKRVATTARWERFRGHSLWTFSGETLFFIDRTTFAIGNRKAIEEVVTTVVAPNESLLKTAWGRDFEQLVKASRSAAPVRMVVMGAAPARGEAPTVTREMLPFQEVTQVFGALGMVKGVAVAYWSEGGRINVQVWALFADAQVAGLAAMALEMLQALFQAAPSIPGAPPGPTFSYRQDGAMVTILLGDLALPPGPGPSPVPPSSRTELVTTNFVIDFGEVPQESTRQDAVHVEPAGGTGLINASSRLLRGGNGIWDFAERLGMYLEWARAHYVLEMKYPEAANAVIPGRYRVHVSVGQANPPAAVTASSVLGYTTMRIDCSLQADMEGRIAGVCFHEHFHAVQARAVKPMALLFANSPWVKEGTAVSMEGELCARHGLPSPVFENQSNGCLLRSYTNVFEQGQKPGYGSALFWLYLQTAARNRRREADLVHTFLEKCGLLETWAPMDALRQAVRAHLDCTLEETFSQYVAANYFQAHGRAFYPTWAAQPLSGLDFSLLPHKAVSGPARIDSSASARPQHLEQWGAEYVVVGDTWDGPLAISASCPSGDTKGLFVLVFPRGEPARRVALDIRTGKPILLGKEDAPGTLIIVGRTEDGGPRTIAYRLDFGER